MTDPQIPTARDELTTMLHALCEDEHDAERPCQMLAEIVMRDWLPSLLVDSFESGYECAVEDQAVKA